MRLLLTNAFGLQNKMGELQHVLAQYDVDIAVVTETKFSENCTLADSSIPGYCSPYRLDRDSHGGGVAVWIKSNIPSMHVAEIPAGGHELLWISVRSASGDNVLVGALYRPGSAAPTDCSLMEHLDQVLQEQDREQYSSMVLAGDFNVHSAEWLGSAKTTLAGEALEDVCAIHGLTQHVNEHTRGSAILDLVISNCPGLVKTTVLPPLGKSDHAVVVCDFPGGELHREEPTVRTVWRYDKADWNRFRSYLRKMDWSTVISDDPEESCGNVTTVIHDAMKKFIPSKSLTTSSSDPPWWTPECAEAMAKKESSWRKWRGQVHNDAYRSAYLESVQRAVIVVQRSRESKMRRIKQRLSSRSLRDKEWWTTIKAACGEGRCAEIPQIMDQNGIPRISNAEKADAFAEYFSKKCSLGEDDLLPHDLPRQDTNDIPPLENIYFREKEVKRRLLRLDVSKATGPDGISARVLKEVACEIAAYVEISQRSACAQAIFKVGAEKLPPGVFALYNV